MSGYFLPPHVHFCQRGDAFVFLDLKQDDYMLVNGAAATALRALSSTRPDAPSLPEQQLSDALNELVKGGLLTNDGSGRAIAPTQIEVAVDNLVDQETLLDTSVTLGQIVNFFVACSAAKLSLRWRSIEATVMSVARRKEKRASRPIDMTRARALTAAFLKLRGLFPANYLCLFDSLALLHFLAKYDIHPTWVFAVRLEPWAAHCWVQHQQYTFNEEAEDAVAYTPVMVI
ncbi:lasso peptide biosynthesis B2 protein [Steroidobacter sp. S1-65]|uniref:Lasso peptide biosynthesis B2 protein n=1 Tax=Steroidobacter gossypii TaxID=2805490 RepID=A0ABS1X216_9GAMM|nr:lasso peptide biosynthesis B2 protein [Steroidobacter gossypii]MBM0107282.1 lasso peptide biosynthesis B2 protein [Steroidobacter gossypii]